ncbi:MAG: competence/damage-inducible protein A [Bacteroidales bacterium]|nr:competence/damage-inducible protein A [Bacteroidales bacterium]MDT8432906.1 competence/damage-inducible protein A [Bacteroidales bacterium]
MTVSIVTIGDEILIGQITDTNAVWIAKKMTLLGMHVQEMVSISDTPEHITDTLDRLLGRTDLVLMTGGLGPTKDDLTKQTLNDYFGGKLVVDEEVLATITEFFNKRGRSMIDSNRRQAEVPDVCRALPNDHGTAPGMWFERDRTIVVSMPGVPYEMKPMVTDQVIPALKSRLEIPTLVHRTIMTYAVPESYLAEMISEWENKLPACMKLAYLPRPGIVRLRLTVRGECAEKANEHLDRQTALLKEKIGDHIFGYDDQPIEQVIGDVLREKGLTVSTAESCTGGNIARLLTSVPGSSAYFKGTLVAYSNEVKTAPLGVDADLIEQYGAVSREVVEAMAKGAMQLLGSDASMATSGIAGPDGGTEEKPVGLVWIAVASGNRVHSREFRFGGHRELVIEQSSIMAIGLLYKLLHNKLEG